MRMPSWLSRDSLVAKEISKSVFPAPAHQKLHFPVAPRHNLLKMYFPLTWSNKAKCEGDFEASHRRIQARIAQEPYRCAREKIHWIMLCQMGENTSDAISQRQHRLQGIQSKEKHDDKGNDCSKKLSDEIAFLGYRYRVTQEFIHKLELNAPAYAPNAEERVLLRQHRDRHGRTFA